MSLVVTALDNHFAAEIDGVDLSRPISNDQAQAIETTLDRYGVVVFHQQPVTDDQQKLFSLHFGRLEDIAGGHIAKPHERRLSAGMADVSNLDKNHQPYARDDRRRLFNLANRLWHSDSSFRPIPAKYSILSARRIEAHGGNTEFADMRRAWDTLDQATKLKAEKCICQHSLLHSRAKLGITDFTDEERTMMQPVKQKLVRTHPVTKRQSLFLSSHIGDIDHWPKAEALCFIGDLLEHATQTQFVYQHKWQQHDLVIWDNRQTIHRVRAFDEQAVRDMRRTTVAGIHSTLHEQSGNYSAGRLNSC